MVKLNNKGMTTIEILVSFVLVAIISSSLYTSVTNYNNKRKLESTKLQINTYKNLLTKEIQDDLIKNGLVSVQKYENKVGEMDIYVVDLELKDHTVKRLVVNRQLADDYVREEGSKTSSVDDYFTIYYGVAKNNIDSATPQKDLEEFPIPDVGYGYNDQEKIVKDLRLTNVIINTDKSTLSIFLGFHHIDEGSKYAINIVSPINFEI